MQSLKRSLRFRWSSSQMEANLEASDLTAIELPPTYLRAFHSLIALDSRGLRPLPPTPKREIVAQRILRCGKRNTSSLLVSATSFFSNVV